MSNNLREEIAKFRWQERYANSEHPSFEEDLPYVQHMCYGYADSIISLIKSKPEYLKELLDDQHFDELARERGWKSPEEVYQLIDKVENIAIDQGVKAGKEELIREGYVKIPDRKPAIRAPLIIDDNS